MAKTVDRGVAYIKARMLSDEKGRIEGVLLDIRRERDAGDQPKEAAWRETLDRLIYARHDGQPMYTPEDVTKVVESLRV